MSLNPTELQTIKDAFNDWAKNHPTPDAPAIGIGSGDILSAKEVAQAVNNGTAQGEALLEMVEHSVRREGLYKTIARFTR